MRKHISFFVLILSVVIFTTTGFLYQTKQNSTAPNELNVEPGLVSTPSENETVQVVPLEEKIGQLFLIGHWAKSPLSSTTDLIRKHHLGGVVIMSAPVNITEINDWTITWNEVAPLPLFIAIDQEGGPVSRLKGADFIQTSQRDISEISSAYEVGKTRGSELKALGINMNFAPVLDSATNPDSFMYERSFPNKTNSAILAAAMIEGMSESSVIGVTKHFPGHNDTVEDSHTTLPTVPIKLSELNAFASQFSDLIRKQEPDAIMTAHILFPNIDEYPASISAFFLTEYLRDTLKYNGLIITDDMIMKAITNTWTSEEASVRAIQAGADIILFAAEPERVTTAINAVITAVKSGQISEERINDSYERILATKQKIK